MKKNICTTPFYTAEIFPNGDVYCCCCDYLKIGAMGNVFRQPWDEIWNSETVTSFRNKIANCDYSQCRTNYCSGDFFPLGHELRSKYISKESELVAKPKIIKISTDRSCQVNCTICRDSIFCNGDKSFTEYLDSQIESVFIPLLKDVEIVNFTGSGDPFVSKHYRKLIPLIAETYPDIKFDLHTNGILCDEENLKKLKISDRLSTVQISLHSASKETYDKIILNGNWDRVIKNIEYLSELIKQEKLEQIHLNFVITSKNYKDIPMFIDLCEKYGAKAFLWQYREIESGIDFNDTNICSPMHENHYEFVKIMCSDKVKNATNLYMSPLLRKYTQIDNINDYSIAGSIIMDVITERYESKYSKYAKYDERLNILESELESLKHNNQKKLPKFLGHFLSVFIPKSKNRKRFREKYVKK